MARVSRRAKQVAKELGVDLSQVKGSGRGGAITVADVRKAAPKPAPPEAQVSPPPPTDIPRRRGKPWEKMTDEGKLNTALKHLGIRKRDIMSHRVYPHKVAIVYGPVGKKATYWPGEE